MSQARRTNRPGDGSPPAFKVFAPDDAPFPAQAPPQKPSKPKKKKQRLPKCLTEESSGRLVRFALDALERCRKGVKRYGPCAAKISAAARDLFFVQFDLGTGLRLAEMCDIKIEDIDLVAQQLLVEHGKGDKERLVPIPDELVPVIREWIGARTSGFLILDDSGQPMRDETVYWRIRRLGRRAGLVKRLHPHVLRHTYAQRIYDLTGDLHIVQELLGHESPATTQIYAHCAPSRLLGAVNKMGLAKPR